MYFTRLLNCRAKRTQIHIFSEIAKWYLHSFAEIHSKSPYGRNMRPVYFLSLLLEKICQFFVISSIFMCLVSHFLFFPRKFYSNLKKSFESSNMFHIDWLSISNVMNICSFCDKVDEEYVLMSEGNKFNKWKMSFANTGLQDAFRISNANYSNLASGWNEWFANFQYM